MSEHQETLIEALVQSGLYLNASEVMREGLHLVEKLQVAEATKLEALRAAAHLGVAALDRGEFKEFADASALIAQLNNAGNKALSDSDGN